MSTLHKHTYIFLFFLYAPISSLLGQHEYSVVERCEEFIQSVPIRNVSKELKQLNEQLKDAQETRNRLLETQTYKQLGQVYINAHNNYSKAMEYYIRSLELEEQHKLQEEYLITHIAIATLYKKIEELGKSVSYLEKALSENKKYVNVHLTVFIRSQLGKINFARNRFDLASKDYASILPHKKATERKFGAEAHFYLAEILTSKGSYDSALTHYLTAIDIQRNIGASSVFATYLIGFGKYCEKTDQHNRALNNYKAGLKIWQNTNNTEKIAYAFNQIGAFYYRQSNYDRAIANINLALKAAKQVNAPYEIQRSYKLLSLCYNKLNDTDNVLKSQYEHLGITEMIERDSIENAESKNKIRKQLQELETQLKMSKKDSTIQELEEDQKAKEIEIDNKKKEIEMHQRNVLLLGISMGLSIIVVVLTFYSYLNKKRSNKKLAEANQQIAQKNEELHDLNATKDKFFSIIGHDLKGPLNSLSSFTFLLKDHIDSMSKEEIQTLATDLDKSQKNLYALMENLLEWSRSQTGNIEFTPEEFDITTILEENLELLKAQAENKNIDLLNVSNQSFAIKSHKNSITTVVRNLISNAIKFTPENGRIMVGWEKNDKEVTVSITDTGVGMPKKVMDKLFRIDTKHSTAGTANEKGTGLGLVLCKEFIEKNGGRIWVESEVDKGSTFSFSLPLC